MADYFPNNEIDLVVQDTPGDNSGALEDLLHSKGRVLKTKLEVLTAEILQRLNLREVNFTRIRQDQSSLQEILHGLTRQANYHQREHREKVPLYQRQLELEKELRSQDVDCWKDVVLVMRDFLTIWEAHEQARSRAIFMNHVGTRPENLMSEA